jgi:Ni,Fe-hydrogenase maturation factor
MQLNQLHMIKLTAVLGTFLLLFISCGIRKATDSFADNLPKLEQHVADLKNQIIPIDSLTLDATLGMLEGLTTAESQEKIDSLIERINLLLSSYLQQTVKDLKVPQLGKDLVGGMIDTLSKESEKLNNLLDGLTAKLSTDLSKILNTTIASLSSRENRDKISSLVSAAVHRGLADSLIQIANRSITGINYSTLGDSIGNNLISNKLTPQIDSLARQAIRGVLDEINIHEAKKSIFSDLKNVIVLAIGGIGLLIALFTWFNRRKYVRVNEMLLAKIEQLSDRVDPNLKKEIHTEAVSQGVSQELDAMLDRVNLLKRKERMGG